MPSSIKCEETEVELLLDFECPLRIPRKAGHDVATLSFLRRSCGHHALPEVSSDAV